MLIGQVVGTVVSTKKDEKLEGMRFLILKQLDLEGLPAGPYVVAVDSLGADRGEVVLWAAGSSARQTALTKDKPVDSVIMAIIDTIEVQGQTRYLK